CHICLQNSSCDLCHGGASAEAFGLIFAGGVLFLSIFGVIYLYWSNWQQKQTVLDELADGLLNHQVGDGVHSAYIQYMQQALILNDVFVDWSEIHIEATVGEGSFGVVHKATFRGAQVAVKQMRSTFSELTEKEIDEFRKEAYMMSRLRHPNIGTYIEPAPLPKSRSQNSVDAYDSSYPGMGMGMDSKKAKPQKTVCIITEFLEQGSLADILYGPTKLPAEVWTYELVLTCALQAARGMLYLHLQKPPICHRDLKSSNLVVDDHWVVKVTDFGMSRIVPETVQDHEKGLDQGSSRSKSGSKSGTSPMTRGRLFSTGMGGGRKFSLGWGTGVGGGVNGGNVGNGGGGSGKAPEMASEERDSGLDPNDLDSPHTSIHSSTALKTPLSPPVRVNRSAEDQEDREDGEGDKKSGLGDKSMHQGGSRLSTLQPEMTSNLGTTAWCAPEVLVSGMKTRYTVKVDVYSFGLVLWELWEKKRPFEELTSRFDIMDAVRAGKRPDISPNCPPTFRSLIQRCWQHDPSRRPMFKYIVRYLKEELARVKRQKSLLAYNPSTEREDDRSSISGLSGHMGEYLRQSFTAVKSSFSSNQGA
ncbi:kinase-like domain-containing protein, partial [Ochromonadaceae sp. CCMP2298]